MINMKKEILFLLFVPVLLSACLQENVNESLEGAKLGEVTNIYEVRDMYHGKELILGQKVLGGAHFIEGVVVSDPLSSNIPSGYLFIQGIDEKKPRALAFKLDGNDPVYRSLEMGDFVRIDLEGKKMICEDGNLIVKNLSGSDIEIIEKGRVVQPKSITVDALSADFEKYESSLVSINADIDPLPTQNEVLAGKHILGDAAGHYITLLVDDGADFASQKLKPSAQYTGICMYGETGEKYLRLLSGDCVQFGSGPLYKNVGGKEGANFPENFEFPLVASLEDTWKSRKIQLTTGTWTFDYCKIGDAAGKDRFNPSGKQSVQFQRDRKNDAYLEMNFDVNKGASKVTFSYGSYYKDPKCTFSLEYSTDGGKNFSKVGDFITDPDVELKVATFMLDIDGDVRFRINKIGLGATSTSKGIENGRLSIDDFAIYQNEW